jgi:hypothetical protein
MASARASARWYLTSRISPQLAQHLASWSVVENIRGYFSELLPVVPLADCIFYLAQPGDELLLIGVVGHLQHVSQFLDLEPIRMQVPLVQAAGLAKSVESFTASAATCADARARAF